MNTENFEVICKDGVALKGMLLIPETPKAVIQINGGTAIPQAFYLPLATFLAKHQYACCTWDYRGSGHSAPQEMKNCHFTYSDYGIKDMPAIKSFLESKFKDLPFLILGHSTGGQQIGFMENLDNVKGVVNFAVSTGYMAEMPLTFRLQSYFLFYLYAPLSHRILGFVNAKRLNIMEDLPSNVVFEWRDWCEKEDYFFDQNFYGKTVPRGHFKNYHFPIHNYNATDDTISTEKNIHHFWKHIHSHKGITYTKMTPSEYGLKSIGHFGFFRKNMENKLWNDVLQKFDAMI